MIFKFLLIGITLTAGFWFMIKFNEYTEFRSVYTQKIKMLNEIFAKINPDLLPTFQLSSFHEFKKGRVKHYPPPIYPEYLKNPEYKKLVEEDKIQNVKFDWFVDRILKIYASSLCLLGISWVIVWLFNNQR